MKKNYYVTTTLRCQGSQALLRGPQVLVNTGLFQYLGENIQMYFGKQIPMIQPNLKVSPLRYYIISKLRQENILARAKSYHIMLCANSKSTQRFCNSILFEFLCNYEGSIQWGSEYQPFEYWKYLSTKLFKVWISNGSVFLWSVYVLD